MWRAQAGHLTLLGSSDPNYPGGVDVNFWEWRGWGDTGVQVSSQAHGLEWWGAGKSLKPCVISSGAQPTSPWPDLLPSVLAPPRPGFLLLPRHKAFSAKLCEPAPPPPGSSCPFWTLVA